MEIVEWRSERLTPKLVYEGEDEVHDATVLAECVERGEVALHVTREAADGPIASVYMTPSEAHLLAERIRTAAGIAEILAAPDA